MSGEEKPLCADEIWSKPSLTGFPLIPLPHRKCFPDEHSTAHGSNGVTAVIQFKYLYVTWSQRQDEPYTL